MKHHKFGKRSREKLAEMDTDLAAVFALALKYSRYDFGIVEALRTPEQQAINVANGTSKTEKSRHFANENGDSEAGDILIYLDDGSHTYEEKYYRKVAAAFFRASFELEVPIEWGGHWESIFDGPHYQKAGGF